MSFLQPAVASLEQEDAFGGLAVQERNLFGVLANAQEVGAKIRLTALLLNIESDQRLSNPMGDVSADDRVGDSQPDHKAGDRQRVTEYREWSSRGEAPEDENEGGKRHDGTEEPSTKR